MRVTCRCMKTIRALRVLTRVRAKLESFRENERESMRLPTLKIWYTNQLFERNTSMHVNHRTVSGCFSVEKTYRMWNGFLCCILVVCWFIPLSLLFPLIQTYDRLGASFHLFCGRVSQCWKKLFERNYRLSEHI